MLQVVLNNQDASKRAHFLNAFFLSLLAIGLCLFFYFLAPLQDTLSKVGIELMIGGIIVRIVIEMVSHKKASSIDFSNNSSLSAQQAKAFLAYRNRIHGPVTIIIVCLYTIGFYMLTPEFSRYFSTFWMWMMDGSYLIVGLIPFLLIRKGVQKELRMLEQINDLLGELEES